MAGARRREPVAYTSRMKKNIAIVEDERAIRDNYAAAFAREGYAVRGYPNRTRGDGGLRRATAGSRGHRHLAGRRARRRLRTVPRTARPFAELPIIFLTARDSELDAVSGLRLGADDFLTKDLSLAHLIARVNALFRRVDALRRPTEEKQVIRRGALSLDSERMSVEWNGQVVLLSLTEFWIVYALTKHPGHVKNRQQLMDAANVVLDDNTITSHIKRIRRKFQVVDEKFDAVHTVYGMGYRWVE